VDTVVLGDLNRYYTELVNTRYQMPDCIFQNDLHMVCTGCSLFFPTKNSIQYTKYVYDNASTAMNDQNFIANEINDKTFTLQYTVFNYMEFANGLLYFTETDGYDIPDMLKDIKSRFRSTTEKNVLFVHANWMVGVDTKIKALKDCGLFNV
jgi:hypothetical protein